MKTFYLISENNDNEIKGKIEAVDITDACKQFAKKSGKDLIEIMPLVISQKKGGEHER